MIINLTSEKLEELIERMKDGDREEFINAVEELREIKRRETKEKVGLLIQRCETASTSDDRFSAFIDLEKTGDVAAVKTLISVLSEDSFVAGLLGKMGDERAVEPLINSLKREKDVLIRGDYARALGEIGDERAVEPLINFLKREKDFLIRGDYARALEKIGDERAVEPLIELVKKRFRSNGAAAEALGEIGDRRAVKPLIDVLRRNKYSNCEVIVKALGKIGDKKAVSPLIKTWERNINATQGIIYKIMNRILRGSLREFIDDWERGIMRHACAAAGALGILGDKYALTTFDTLLDLLKNDDFVSSASNALGKIGDIRAVEPLIATLISLDEYADFKTMAIAEALGKLGDNRAVEPLTTKLWNEHISGRVCLAITDALEKLGDKRAVEPLIEVLKKEYSKYDDSPIPAIAKTLGELGDEIAIDPLLETLRGYHEDKQTMDSIIDAVRKLKSGQ